MNFINETAGRAIANKPDNSRIRCDSNGQKNGGSGRGGGRRFEGAGRKSGGGTYSSESKQKYWKELEKIFLPYWIVYGRGRSNFESCKIEFHKMRKTKKIPDLADFYGIVCYYRDNIWRGDYVQDLSKFLEEADWRFMDARVLSEIKSRKEHNQRAVERLVREYNGETNMPPQQNKQEPQKQAQEQPPPIPDYVPPAEEIIRMPLREQMQLASDCGYGMPVSIYLDAVRLRDQSRNKTTQEEL